MWNFGLGSAKGHSESLKSNIQPEDDKYRSIFTYNAAVDNFSGSSSNPPDKNDPGRKAPTSESSGMKKYSAEYSKLGQKEDHEMESGIHMSAFDYKSIFSYSGPERYGIQRQMDSSKKSHGASGNLVVPGVSEKLIAKLALVLSYMLVFFTLPISIWFCFKTLPQWERAVIYRLGKLKGVKGPGNIFLIPWLDSCSKLDLRTQLICHPMKQFLAKDQAIVEAECSIYYRIYDPVMYVSNMRDPELRGLKQLANAITLKRFETSYESEFHPSKKTIIEGRILEELNCITTPWGIEISSVQIENCRIIQEAKPVNAFMDVMQQIGASFGIDNGGSDQATSLHVAPNPVSLADVGFSWQEDVPLNSRNAIKLQRLLDAATAAPDIDAVICFKVGSNQEFYADFRYGKGRISENEYLGGITTTISLPQSLFDSLMNGASQSQFLQAYLNGQITIDGDTQALMQLQKLLPNLIRLLLL